MWTALVFQIKCRLAPLTQSGLSSLSILLFPLYLSVSLLLLLKQGEKRAGEVEEKESGLFGGESFTAMALCCLIICLRWDMEKRGKEEKKEEAGEGNVMAHPYLISGKLHRPVRASLNGPRSMPLMVGLTRVASRRTTNSKPSLETSVT